MEKKLMETHVERLRMFLGKNINTEIFKSNKALYEAFIKVEKDGNQSNFDSCYLTHLFYDCMYRYNKVNGLQSLTKLELPFIIPQNIDFEGFCIQMSKYLNIPFENNIIKNDNYRNLCIRCLCKLIGHDTWGGWTFLDFATIEGNKNCSNSKNYSKKLYLSVDNKDLHFFALQLIEKATEIGLKYDFKINADDRYRRADNVVIYSSEEDVKKYVELIEKIKFGNPKMDFGYIHLLAKPINEYIGFANMEEPGATESHSSILCDKIIDLRNKAVTFEKFFKEVKALVL